MSGQPTRGGLPGGSAAVRSTLVPAEWRNFGAFLRHPTLPDRARLSLRGSAAALVPLLVLDMVLMGVVLGAVGIATSLGFKLPPHMLNDLEVTGPLIGFIIVGAPLAEEALFRGWLSGRPGHVLAVLAVLAGGAVLLVAAAPVVKFAGAVAGVVLAAALLFALRKRDAWAWFQRRFGWFYYASAVLFAGIHLTNFGSAGQSLAMLPLVLPQFLLALILGYLRVNRGLLTGAVLHMLHNALFASLMLAGIE